MKTKLLALVLAAALVAIAGCNPSPRTGAVGWQGMPIGSQGKDIPFTASDGTQTTFHKVRAPIAVVAFVQMPGDQCCWISPRLMQLTQRYQDLPISVAEISEPTAQCPHGPGCMELCRLSQTRLFAFCDPDKIAWNAYNNPAPGTVLLLDQRDKVVEVAKLSDLKVLADKAYDLGTQLRASDPDKIRRAMWMD
jgi:hypothetical protein